MRLDGAVALLTGASSGIGRALAVELSQRGARLILLGRRIEALDETRMMLRDPSQAWMLPADLTDPEQRRAVPALARACAGRLDLLINNAGAVAAGLLEAQSEEAWRRLLEINLVAPMALSRDLCAMLAASGQGRIVNIGSMFGDIAFPHFAAYSASKFALRGWSDALRREYADLGIGVTYCAPRGTRTAAADGFMAYAEAYAMPLDPPERVARRIAAGIMRDARNIYPAGPERLFLLLQRLFPSSIDRALRGQYRTATRRLTAPSE
ncbi:MAG TPA: SDR family NAD(P)-dependent oxidoreductase [Alphaproteobacteria bacterium]|nr:SDR family NAD(P)-dependent oxidoreductase [Alphaproteobacteria bacterium]